MALVEDITSAEYPVSNSTIFIGHSLLTPKLVKNLKVHNLKLQNKTIEKGNAEQCILTIK